VTLTRRDMLRLAASVAAAPLVPPPARAAGGTGSATTPAAGRFFSAAEMALLDELTERIIPADEHSGGARAAGVGAYIDARLGDYDPGIPGLRAERDQWKAGLATVDALARELAGVPFLEAPAEDRVVVLERLAAGEPDPKTDGERFFVELKRWTVFGYYTSRVGIHDEIEYKGNSLLVEFAGTDPATLPAVPPREDPRPVKP